MNTTSVIASARKASPSKAFTFRLMACRYRRMSACSPDQLFAYLDGLGITHQTVQHPAVFTVEEARALRGKVPGGHTKNLFLRDKKGALFLVVAPEDAAIELKSLHRA